VKVRESSKAKVDLTADALRLSLPQILDAVIERADVDRFGVVNVPLELVRRARDGVARELPTLYGTVQVRNKEWLGEVAKRLNTSQAILMDAMLQQVPVLPDGTIKWAHELVPAQPDLFSAANQPEEAKQAS
jgi:hypothetical protein